MHTDSQVRFFTIQQAAAFLNISKGTVRNEIKRGRLKVLRFGTEGKAVRILLEDLLALVATAQATNDPSSTEED